MQWERTGGAQIDADAVALDLFLGLATTQARQARHPAAMPLLLLLVLVLQLLSHMAVVRHGGVDGMAV